MLFAMDMHDPFANAVRRDPGLAHVAIVHDPVHIMKRAGEAVDELRRRVLFRAGPDLRALGRGKRWSFLRAWVRLNVHDSLLNHFDAIVALGAHRPPTGRIEAMNNNWETLVRRGRGYRDLTRMLRRLRFMVVTPLSTGDGLRRLLALGATPPFPVYRAA